MPDKRSTAEYCVALGKVVRAERKRLESSQEQLAEQAGLSRAYLTELESGHRTPNLGTLLALSRALGMKPSRLMAACEAKLQS